MTPEQFREWLDNEVDKFSPIPERKKGISEKTWDFIILQAGTERVAYELGATAAYNLLSGDDGWIRVEDGLPDKEGKYLCGSMYDAPGTSSFVQLVSEFALFKSFATGEILGPDEDGITGCFLGRNKVTHWRHLPEAPKK